MNLIKTLLWLIKKKLISKGKKITVCVFSNEMKKALNKNAYGYFKWEKA